MSYVDMEYGQPEAHVAGIGPHSEDRSVSSWYGSGISFGCLCPALYASGRSEISCHTRVQHTGRSGRWRGREDGHCPFAAHQLEPVLQTHNIPVSCLAVLVTRQAWGSVLHPHCDTPLLIRREFGPEQGHPAIPPHLVLQIRNLAWSLLHRRNTGGWRVGPRLHGANWPWSWIQLCAGGAGNGYCDQNQKPFSPQSSTPIHDTLEPNS
jgi:hypothetical protein